MKSSSEIRRAFLDYFESRGHRVVSSSPLVPANDPSLLFTNAGMVQFKDVFLGVDKRDYKRAVTSQRCVRAGGKHNDLDQVGYTARHHTFFEMLGNFSFGDYFKEDAIGYAWEFLTEVAGLPSEKLWVTVYHTDDEAYGAWTEQVGVPADRVVRIGDKPGGREFDSDNFWAMGDTGPCGPCTEIFYDHGLEIAGGPPGSPDEEGDRYVEIWNLVFMQFDRDGDGNMRPLPKPCVDTGMGLERLAAVLQGVHSNYQIDIFERLIAAAAEFTGADDLDNNSLKVIADHIRACTFLILDGVLPANDGRGYVLRRIIRRAIRHGYQLGQKEPFFHRMVEPLAVEMGDAYPELNERGEFAAGALRAEEERFAETLGTGMRLLEDTIAGIDDDLIPGEAAFKLYDTYGFPVDLTADIARERGYRVDLDGFEAAMDEQRARARAASRFASDSTVEVEIPDDVPKTEFLGYQHLSGVSAEVVALISDGQLCDSVEVGQEATVILNQTPFYAESGGQVGDRGELAGTNARFQVADTRKLAGDYHGHFGRLESGTLKRGDVVKASIDVPRRRSTVLNHSGTHLLHAALRAVLGEHVQQKGSLVAPDRLRFDFSHPAPVTPEELREIERLTNENIRENHAADIAQMAYDEALKSGALALFGEKYGDRVRVLKFGDFSVELCGGTHVERAGDIGLLKIVSETGIAAGVRRVEALTGAAALDWVEQRESLLGEVAGTVKAPPAEVGNKVREVIERNRELEKQLQALKSKLAGSAGDDLAQQAQAVDGVKVVAARVDNVDPKQLRNMVDKLKDKLGSSAVVLATVNGSRVQLVAGVSKDQTGRIKAGDLVNAVAEQIGGRGGGRPDMAQAGGDQPENLATALESVTPWVADRLAG